MAGGEFGLRLGGWPVARVGVGAAHLGMRGDGTSMPRGFLFAPDGSFSLVGALTYHSYA